MHATKKSVRATKHGEINDTKTDGRINEKIQSLNDTLHFFVYKDLQFFFQAEMSLTLYNFQAKISLKRA